MRLISCSMATMVLAGWAFAQGSTVHPSERRIYFLRDNSHKRWCGYASEPRLRAQVQVLRAMVVGAAYYEANIITVVHVTEVDETGDWAVNDAYTFDEKGGIAALRRTINVIPEDFSEEQVFRISGGKATEQSGVYRDLHTGKLVLEKTADWFEPPPVMTDPRKFDFWALIAAQRQSVWSRGEACVPDVPK